MSRVGLSFMRVLQRELFIYNCSKCYITKPQNVLSPRLPFCLMSNHINSIARDNDGMLNIEQPDFQIITKGEPDLEKKLKVIFLEVDVMRQEGHEVPSSLKTEEWKELLSLSSRSSRRKYLTFLFKREMKRANEKRKKEDKRLKRTEALEAKKGEKGEDSNGHINYGLSKNTIFLHVRETTMNHFYNWKLMQAMQFGQKLVVDCGFDQDMANQERVNCAKQFMMLFAENRMHVDPFNLYLCNAVRNTRTMKEFEKLIRTAYEPHFPLNITEKSYLDIFPKEKLVYLTPHCREELTKFDYNAVYIIGGIVDKINQQPLSLAKAKREGVKMAKLPLDKYLLWGSGSGKSLTLNQMIQILLDIRHTGDWKTALKHVPQRKLVCTQSEDSTERRERFVNRLKWR